MITTTHNQDVQRAEAKALVTPGTILAWGSNTAGQLGDGTTTNRTAPVAVPGVAGIKDIAAGNGYVLALLSNGTVRAWGSNSNGQLGDGTKIDRRTPVPVPGLSGVVALAGGSAHSLALLADGRLFAWGRNLDGQLGLGAEGSDRTSPVLVPNFGLSRVKAIAAADNHTLVLLSDGTVLACGNNSNGQLGDGTKTDHSSFAPVQNLIPVKAIATGRRHSLALTTNGVIRAWGDNSDGQLGNGSTTDSNLPTTVNTDSLDERVIAIAAGGLHSLALLAHGRIEGWGNNTDGQLGDGGTNSPRVFPVNVAPGAEIAIRVDAGGDHSVALMVDGTVRTWGDNGSGQLGDGTTTRRVRPVQVLGLTGIIKVVAGNAFCLALQ
jgi:alpha-tubulin suppressor-like RCC1 family protein